MFKRIKAIFSGTVQGVGFRASAQRLAQDFVIDGTVRNLPNGSVEILAEGEQGQLQDFISTLQESHLSVYIRTVTMDWDQGRREFSGFRII